MRDSHGRNCSVLVLGCVASRMAAPLRSGSPSAGNATASDEQLATMINSCSSKVRVSAQI